MVPKIRLIWSYISAGGPRASRRRVGGSGREGSELQLERELNLPLRRAAERARRARQHRRDRAERRVAELPVRVAKLRMVQQVERFDAHLAVGVPDSRVFDERSVDVELPRPAYRVAAGRAERPGRVGGPGEARGVEPFVDGRTGQ